MSSSAPHHRITRTPQPKIGTCAGAGDRLLAALRRRGLNPVGERSCKMRDGELLTERFLLGIPVSELPLAAFLELLAEFGMDSTGLGLFRQHFPGVSEVQFALEQDGDRTQCKVYLEYWDRLVERLGRGETGPALLNLGFKWPVGRPREMVKDRYICHPKLRHHTIIERLSACQGQLSEQVVALVAWASETVADGSLVYLEVDDATGGRHSYDIKLYPCNRHLADAASRLALIAERLNCDPDALREVLQRYADAPLGHISGGSDHRGRCFFTFYYEVGAL